MRKIPATNRNWIEQEIPLLEAEGLLDSPTAQDLHNYYREQTVSAGGASWALTAFSILGALLIGAGIILLFAHNWDTLTRDTRVILSFSPLLIGAVLSLAAVLAGGRTALRESAGLFHTIAIGGSIALIGQTYHLPSDTPMFLLTWALLALPLVFLLSSTGAFLIYLALISSWSAVAQDTYRQAAAFWPLLLPALLYLVLRIRRAPRSQSTLLAIWGWLVCITVSMGIVFERNVPGLWIVAYASLLSGAYLVGLIVYGDIEGWANPFGFFGFVGVCLLSYLFTWSDFWDDIGWNYLRSGWQYHEWGIRLDTTVTMALLAAWAVAIVRGFRQPSLQTGAVALFPIVSVLCFLLGAGYETPTWVMAVIFNVFLLFLGVLLIVQGCCTLRLRKLNGGMFLLSLLLITRFFDADFGFFARGVVFIVLGICFLTANLVLSRRKKEVLT